MVDTLLFYDSETTGLPLWSEPSEDPRQPHIVQLAGMLARADTGAVLASFDVIVKPTDWVIPDEAAAVHGITQEMAMDLGVPEALAVEMLLDMARFRVRVAHNESFDQRMVRIACKRFFDEPTSDEWKAGRTQCTALMSEPIVQLPPTDKMRRAGRGGQFKKPTLAEAYRHFTGRELEGAHSALADARACAEVYFGCLRATQPEAAAA